MPTVLAHAAVAAGAFLLWDRGEHPGKKAPLLAAALAALPDLDVAWWGLTTYGAPWGHRGMTHSLTFAVLVGTVVAFVVGKRLRLAGGVWGTALFFTLIIASHGVLDGLTNGGYGIAFFSPFDTNRNFLPVTPIPVSPITVNPLNPWLWRVLGREALLFGPLAWTMATWWSPPFRGNRWVCGVGLLASAAFWVSRLAA